MQPEREQEQSYIQRRVYEFRVEIRRSERETLRAKMRKKIMNEAQLSLFF